ncbi:MAG: histidine-type phosphatase [Clostridia bacterium]|nr:histidine-type phosphatase [Clostridia bacterium]
MKKGIGLLLALMLLVPALCMAAPSRISYLGPAGTYTEEATRFWFQEEGTFQPRETVSDAIQDVLNGEADYAVIPQENTLGGAVVNYVDALMNADNVFVVGEVVLPISQTLMALPGATLEEIKTVCSHAQGLTQSAQWRAENLPGAEAVEMKSTAAAAEYVAGSGDKSIAAVAAPGAAALYGLEVLAENVQISLANKTRFYVLAKNPAEGPNEHAVFVVNGNGENLSEFIVGLNAAGLRVAALHDRPAGTSLGQYRFLVEAENGEGITEEQVAACMSDEVRFAGSFHAVEKGISHAERKMDKVVVLSRHNIRSPLSGSGSLLGDITPHPWFNWTSKSSELSMLGAVSETKMGQYFRLWLESEGLFPENYRPEEGAVRFYANAKQRTFATSRYFSSGLFPAANTPIETHAEYDTMDPVFSPVLTYCSAPYAEAVMDQMAQLGGTKGMEGISDNLREAISLLMEVTDMKESEAYRAGTYGDLLKDATTIHLETGKEASMTGPIKTATSVADAMTFQYYEMTDAKAAAFGHDLTFEDWQKLHTIVDTYTHMLFETPLIAVNVANPLLREIRSEMETEGRIFTFLCGHDSNIASVLAALDTEEYLLTDTVEQHTPIGVKLAFTRWLDEKGEAYWTVELIYMNTEQLRSRATLSLETPPSRYTLHFKGVEDRDGMIAEADLFHLLDEVIDRYNGLTEQFDQEEDAAA